MSHERHGQFHWRPTSSWDNPGYRNRPDHWDPDVWDEHDADESSASDDATADSRQDADARDQDPTTPSHSLQTVGRAATPSGSIEVRTTMQGLPTAIRIERSEMDKSASTVAKTLLMLCRQAGTRAGADHRAALLAQGHTLETVSYLDLPTPRQAAEVDETVDAFLEEYEPDTWMRRV